MKRLEDYPDAHLRRFERPPLPPPTSVRTVYLIGICGTGMGTLALLLREAGYQVSGSDAAAYPPMSTLLHRHGISFYTGFDPAHLEPPPDLVVVGNACTPTHPEAAAARERRLPQCAMPEALSHFFLQNRQPVVVAGTHGKTTTAGLLAHVLSQAGMDPGYFIGGVMIGSETSGRIGSGPWFVVEGDEYDSAYFDKRPKFLHYRPRAVLLTSIEFDHADLYDDLDDYREAFEQLVALLPFDGLLIAHSDDPTVRQVTRTAYSRVRTYGLHTRCNVTVGQVYPTPEGQHFTLVVDGQELGRFFLPLSGRHNLRNALAVCAFGLQIGLTPEQLRKGLASFPGMKRRLEVRGEAGGVLVVDDFAHHPTAVRETLRAARQRWPDRRLVAIFEPRSNSSRRRRFEQAYMEAFDDADEVWLSTPPFRHNDHPEDFFSPEAVAAGIRSRGIPAHIAEGAHVLLPLLLEALRPGDVALIMSNGPFGNLHERLLQALTQQTTSEASRRAHDPLSA
ncbi:UDP-N-acetylmuramate:L-alanyl-gamma-D-glutamyl-meso-diaminopimelate ligase [Rhodothermus profundi]|uniref:UDP-N-acetylmuramate--L-alanine ligase n=1 Tax=Rhodothermus profundi TaxID=633813 RepID=A0A1M6VF05_9BACT|nr:UDP-N-acetylmuramate:L-alanyl-gamma-D-glutamyl-meso-diaminopimelate ligase [Rhodothermus profundi]SHK80072.1 UDP-N-acetylmuramate--L-alanine ligase [Rhodothermus profundi]